MGLLFKKILTSSKTEETAGLFLLLNLMTSRPGRFSYGAVGGDTGWEKRKTIDLKIISQYRITYMHVSIWHPKT